MLHSFGGNTGMYGRMQVQAWYRLLVNRKPWDEIRETLGISRADSEDQVNRQSSGR